MKQHNDTSRMHTKRFVMDSHWAYIADYRVYTWCIF